MKTLLHSFLITVLCFTAPFISLAQIYTLTGVVLEKGTERPVSFAHIGIENSLEGTIANDKGVFSISVNEYDEFITVTSVGYEENLYQLSATENEITVYLTLWNTQLDEALVMPKTAREYITEALARHSKNLSSTPFSSESYFSSTNYIENAGLVNIKRDEAVFKSQYMNFSDTSAVSASQLLLHRFYDNEVEVDMSIVDNKKSRKKLDKLKEKMEEEEMENDTEEPANSQEDGVNLGNASGQGGPEYVLSVFQDIGKLNFFDNAMFDKINFILGKANYVNGRELITIHFSTKKPIYLMFEYEGTIHLDAESLAFVSLEYNEDVELIGLVRFLIKRKTGIKIESFNNHAALQFQPYEGYWYPQQITFNSKMNFKQPKALKKEERLNITNKQVFSVNRFNFNDVIQIQEEYVYDSSKEYEEQVFPDEDSSWDKINVVN